LAEEAEARKNSSALKGNPNGAYQEPSYIVAARELMVSFNYFEKESDKNPQINILFQVFLCKNLPRSD
jgi:hypothetical protein